MGRRAKAVTDVPVLLGVGISTPEQAAEAAAAADGVIVGSALIARLLDGGGPEGAHALRSRAFRARHSTTVTAGTDRAMTASLRVRRRLRPLRGGAHHAVVPRGRRLLDRGVRDLRGADGGVARARHRAARDRARAHAHAARRGRRRRTSRSSTTSTTTCATSPTTTTRTPAPRAASSATDCAAPRHAHLELRDAEDREPSKSGNGWDRP